MKILAGFLFLFAALHIVTPAAAQDSSAYILYDGEYGDSVSHYIQKLMKGGKDTIIRFDLPENHLYNDTLPENFPTSYPDISYIFYKEGTQTVFVQYSSYLRFEGGVSHYMSDPKVLEQDTIFRWLALHLNTVREEEIFPFITQVKENNNTIRHLQWDPLYSSHYGIEIYTPAGRFRKYITPDHLEKCNRHQMVNINYDQNISTKLWQLFLLLDLRCQDLASTQTVPGSQATGDTIYFAQSLHSTFPDSYPGIGNIILFEVKYTMARSGDNVLCRKFIEYCNNDCTDITSATSDWLESKNDTLFSWLIPQLNTIRKEEIAPFIYQIKNDSLNFYYQFRSSHMFYDDRVIDIHSGQGNFKKIVNPRYWQKELHEGTLKNANYAFNVSTRLYHLFNMLEQRCDAWDEQFVFPTFKKGK